jgi:hypothetical protein
MLCTGVFEKLQRIVASASPVAGAGLGEGRQLPEGAFLRITKR